MAIRSPGVGNAFSNVRGYSLLEDGEFEQAIEQFQAVANRSPNEANPWDSLGEGYLANGMPDKALEAYSRALAIDPAFEASILGRGLALAALGRYDEALERESPDFRVQAFLLSRVGRYREAQAVLDKGRQDDDAEVSANSALTSAWLLIEQKQYARAIDEVRRPRRRSPSGQNHSLLVLADLIGGVAEIRSGNVKNATVRLEAQKARYDSAPQSNRIGSPRSKEKLRLRKAGTIEAAVELQSGAKESVADARTRRVDSFAINLPSRDGLARVEIARGNRAAAIEEYRRLTVVGPGNRSSAVLEPRYILAAGAFAERRKGRGRRACRVRALPEVVGQC